MTDLFLKGWPNRIPPVEMHRWETCDQIA